MPRYIILAQSEVTAKALNTWLKLLGNSIAGQHHPRWIVWERHVGNGITAVEAYQTLVTRIDRAATGDDDLVPLNEIVVLVDSVKPAQSSNAVAEGGWNAVVAMLILTFPEVRWIFGVSGTAQGWEKLAVDHSLGCLLEPVQREALFDPTGLRDWVRTKTKLQIRDGDGRPGGTESAQRSRICRSAKKWRPRSRRSRHTPIFMGTPHTASAAERTLLRLGGDVERLWPKASPHDYWLLLEDMSLNFPDKPGGIHLLRLDRYKDNDKDNGRAEHCPQLDSTKQKSEHSEYRIIITTGQTRQGDNAVAENRGYLRNKAFGKGKIVFKPASGMFDLWDKVGLLKVQRRGRRTGNAPCFCLAANTGREC